VFRNGIYNTQKKPYQKIYKKSNMVNIKTAVISHNQVQHRQVHYQTINIYITTTKTQSKNKNKTEN